MWSINGLNCWTLRCFYVLWFCCCNRLSKSSSSVACVIYVWHLPCCLAVPGRIRHWRVLLVVKWLWEIMLCCMLLAVKVTASELCCCWLGDDGNIWAVHFCWPSLTWSTRNSEKIVWSNNKYKCTLQSETGGWQIRNPADGRSAIWRPPAVDNWTYQMHNN